MSIYNLTLEDVLAEWWMSEWDLHKDKRYELNRHTSRIHCRTCTITWLRVHNNKIEYALKPNGEQFFLEPGDPKLFEKMSWILNTVEHDPFYGC